jgi:hypothetical protein
MCNRNRNIKIVWCNGCKKWWSPLYVCKPRQDQNWFVISWHAAFIIFAHYKSQKISKNIGVFYTKQSKIMQSLIKTLFFFRKTPIFFVEYCLKSQKIVIITSTPGWLTETARFLCLFGSPACTTYIFLDVLFLIKKLPPYTLAGFDLESHSSSLLGVDHAARSYFLAPILYYVGKYIFITPNKKRIFFANLGPMLWFLKIFSPHRFLRKRQIFSPKIGKNRRNLWSYVTSTPAFFRRPTLFAFPKQIIRSDPIFLGYDHDVVAKVQKSGGKHSREVKYWGPFLTSPLVEIFAPRGEVFPQGWILSPRAGWSYPPGVKFSVRPSMLLNSRECSPYGGDQRGEHSP